MGTQAIRVAVHRILLGDSILGEADYPECVAPGAAPCREDVNRGKWAGYTAEAWDLSALLLPSEGCDKVQDRCLAEEEPFSTDELAASLFCNQSGSWPTVTLKPLEAFSHFPDHSYMLWPGSKTLDSSPSSTIN